MTNILRMLFGSGKKDERVLPQQEVHSTRNKYTVELLKIQRNARIIGGEAREIKRLIDTATSIAIATGGKRRGL
jgi:hypothetical protein